jgi:hypothetical protein
VPALPAINSCVFPENLKALFALLLPISEAQSVGLAMYL